MELVNTIEGLRDANRSLEQNLLEATTANQVCISSLGPKNIYVCSRFVVILTSG